MNRIYGTDDLFRLLAAQSIEVLMDVRSSPYSRFAPQANREPPAAAVRKHGVRYVFCGGELGGRPADLETAPPSGKADYAQMETTEAYRRDWTNWPAFIFDRRGCSRTTVSRTWPGEPWRGSC